MNKALENFKRKFEENPVEVIGVTALATSVVVKLMNALTERKNAKTYRMETQRRIYKNHR